MDDPLHKVWRRFDAMPMETLTKAWIHQQEGRGRQRRCQEMADHRQRTGASGNCFDLAVWLWEEFMDAGVRAHAIGDALFTEDAHVALLAYDANDSAYLCDLGDMWLQPLPLALAHQPLRGYYPAAEILLTVQGQEQLHLTYERPGGKVSDQTYDLRPVDFEELLAAGEHCQSLLSPPLVEMRLWEHQPPAHWELDGDHCFFSTDKGLIPLPASDLARVVETYTHMQADYARACLQYIQTNLK